MSLFRFRISGAIPPPANPTEQAWLDDLIDRLHILKEHCVIINEGEPNAEDITRFTYHICHHDEGDNHPPCEGEIEI